MSVEQFSAEIQVPKAGFKWCDAGFFDVGVDFQYSSHDPPVPRSYWDLIKGRYLVPVGRYEFETRTFDPFAEHTGLFLTFARLPVTEDAILNFANRYGWLGRRERVVQESDLPEDDMSTAELEEIAYSWDIAEHSEFSGEGITAWDHEITRMRKAVDLWKELRNHEKRTTIDRLAPTKTKQEITAGWRHLEALANSSLGSTGGVRLSWDGDQTEFRFQFQTEGLGKTLWLQFARAIVGKKEYERCKHCHSYFEIGPGAGRKGKAYCTDACKSAAWRSRKEQKT